MAIQIYKASAGSGKTYTLVYEYIKYMFAMLSIEGIKNGEYNKPLNFHRRILAVTFTNKSTAEMKERIVSALYDMIQGKKEDYVKKLRKDMSSVLKDVEDDVIARITERFLIDILQDYTMFRVSTIDGFFQQIVRSFARELNLNNQYSVELDTDIILEMAVDGMLASLGKDNSQLLAWLTEFATDKVDFEGTAWNPRFKILSLAKMLTKESYMLQKDKFGFDLKQLREYRDNLREIIRKFDADLKMVCDEAKGSFDWNDGLEWFGKNRISRFDYEYLVDKEYELSDTFTKGAESDDLEKWCKGKKKRVELQPIVTKLHKCVIRIVELCEGERFREYQTAKILNSYIYVLGILNEIDNYAMDICKAKDCLLISSTSDFINKIIDGSDTPFIYEKVGVRTEHFMIDEFQDTSRLQWSNFVPLLKETVSQGSGSMIVGDVKQSIYRWRNGDWSILHEGIKKEFGDYVKDDSSDESLRLDKNYRSSAEVIGFNNKLYSELPKLIDAQLKAQKVIDEDSYLQDIYADSKQEVGKADAPKGYVRVEFLANDATDKEQKWNVQSLNHMVETMHELGNYGEMAVLVRVHKEAQAVAAKLKEVGIPFYSSEALCVADDAAVRFILAVLEYLVQPYEQLFRANLLALHREVCLGRMIGEEDHELISYGGDNYAMWEKSVFGNEEVAERFDRAKYMSLLSMIESLVGVFDLNEVDGGVHSIFLQSFIDKVQTYAIDGTLDLKSLLEYWSIEGKNTFIAMPEGGDAVRIITIHKSKGLEFGVVFIPFMDWNMAVASLGNYQLVETKEKTRNNHLFIDEVPVVPINTQSSSKLFNSEFKDDIVREFLATCLDKLNMLYVATTRASQQLYIYCNDKESQSSKKESNEISRISIAEALRSILPTENKYFYESNDKVAYSPKKKADNGDVETIELVRNKEFLPSDEEVAARARLRFKYSEDTGEGEARMYGVMMHKLFERIITLDDVDNAIEWMARDGEDVEGLRSEVEAILALEGVAELFDARWRVMNEAEIFDAENGRIYRPDRVMIDDENREVVVVDYKFGEYTDEVHSKYQRQVSRYVRLIKDMGYDARGYLLYATERKLFDLK